MLNNNQNTPFLLVELLENFSEKEINGLRQIIKCDYFNKDKRAIKLLEVLVKKIIRKNKSNIQIQCILFKQVFEEAFKSTTLTKKQKSLLSAKMSVLTKLAKRFLTIEALENSKMNKSDLILNALLKKKQFRLFEKQIEEEHKILNKNADYYDHLVTIGKAKLQYLYQSGKWEKEDNFAELMEYLDISYLIKKLTHTTTTLSFLKLKPSIKCDSSVLNMLESEYFSHYRNLKIPLINIRIAVINVMLSESNSSFNQLLQILRTNESKIAKNELRDFYTVATNFCIDQFNKGKFDYSHQYVSIYKNLDENELIGTDNSITAEELNNIVIGACRIQEFEWINGIIEKYVLLVEKSVRENVRNFCLGFVSFHKKEYHQSIDYMGKVDNFSFHFDIIKRVILIRSYFELDKHYLYAVAQIFRSFEAFIHNHKSITKSTKTGYKNFIRVALNLYRLKHNVGIIKIATLKAQIFQAASACLSNISNPFLILAPRSLPFCKNKVSAGL